MGSALHIVTATGRPAPGMGAASGAALVDSGAGEALADEAHRQVGEQAIADFGSGLEAETHAAQGNADDVILSTAVEVWGPT